VTSYQPIHYSRRIEVAHMVAVPAAPANALKDRADSNILDRAGDFIQTR
jgi:hypothetical protein